MALTFFKRLFSDPEPHARPGGFRRPEHTILLVSPSRREQDTARVISVSEGWRIRIAATIDVALRIQAAEPITVVLYDQDLPNVEWRHGMSVLIRSSMPPCLILLSFVMQERLRREVLLCGGYDGALKPLDRKTLGPLVNGCRMLINDINCAYCREG